jgi:hypothetical protein
MASQIPSDETALLSIVFEWGLYGMFFKLSFHYRGFNALISSFALRSTLLVRHTDPRHDFSSSLSGVSALLFALTLSILCHKRPLNRSMVIVSVLFFLLSTVVSSRFLLYIEHIEPEADRGFLVAMFSTPYSTFFGYIKVSSLPPARPGVIFHLQSTSTMSPQSCSSLKVRCTFL